MINNRLKNKAVTLVELLLILAIIAILTSLLLPSLRKARRTSQVAVSVNNMRSIYVAMQQYAPDNDRRYNLWVDNEGGKTVSWDDKLSSYLGVSLTQAEINSDQPPLKEGFDVFACPLDNFIRESDFYKRTYAVNSFGPLDEKVFGQFGTGSSANNTQSKKTSQLIYPTQTVALMERAHVRNVVGETDFSNMGGSGGRTQVTIGSSNETDANHHSFNGKAPLLFFDGHIQIRYLPPLNDIGWIWRHDETQP